jgi:aldose 1-epimerase
MKTTSSTNALNEITLQLAGTLANNQAVYSHVLKNKNGMQVEVLSYGATIKSIKIPIAGGTVVDVVLGFDDLESYVKSYDLPSAPYFGTTVGRYAGRINKGVFHLNGQSFQLNKNNNENALHGGNVGFGKKVWEITKITTDENPSITLSLTSEHLDENFPGELTVDLTYTLTEENELTLEYHATSTEDTIINLTHHSYFNLNGHDSTVLDQEILINSDQIVETTPEGIPTGNFLNLKDHPFNFSTFQKCPASIDNSFVIEPTDKTVAKLYSPKNKLQMSVHTDQPSVHIYVGGNCFDLLKGKGNTNYHPSSGICFETQNFPDAPNHAHFPNAILKKGDQYDQRTVYKFENIL